MKDLIGDMHQLKDPKDIDRSKKFTRSVLFERDQISSQSLAEYQFQHMKPMEDFVRPEDQASPRNTGYEPGHIRSMLKLDVFGPASSSVISRERELGVLPRSPNLNRHEILNPSYVLTVSGGPAHSHGHGHSHTGGGRPGTGQSADSRASSANSTSYNGAFPSLKSLRQPSKQQEEQQQRQRQQVRQLGSSGRQSVGGPGPASVSGMHHSSSSPAVLPSMGGSNNNSSNNMNGSRRNSRSNLHDTGTQRLSSAGHEGEYVLFDGPGLGVGDASAPRRIGTAQSTGTRASTANSSAAGSRASRTSRMSLGMGATGADSAVMGPDGKFPTVTFPGVAITEEERLQGGDPFLRRTMWYKNYAANNKVRI
jgi:hypothetical protein